MEGAVFLDGSAQMERAASKILLNLYFVCGKKRTLKIENCICLMAVEVVFNIFCYFEKFYEFFK